VYGEGFKRKKECILFSLKTFSHKTVSNHSVVILLRGLCGLEHSCLQECGRENINTSLSPTKLHDTIPQSGRVLENSKRAIAGPI
jgi:hypothetical protein